MVLAGSMTLTMLPMTASAEIGATITIVDDESNQIATIDPSDITSSGFSSGYLSANNMWAVGSWYIAPGVDSGYINATVSGNNLAGKLNEYKESNTTYYDTCIKYSHKYVVTTDDPETTNIGTNNAKTATTFPVTIDSPDPLASITGFTVWYGVPSGGTIYSCDVLLARDVETDPTDSISIPMSTFEGLYTAEIPNSDEMRNFVEGVTIIQVQNSGYKTFEIPVYDGLGKPTGEKISVTNDSTGELIPVGETEALKGKYKLVYNDESFPYVTQSSYVTAKDGLWSEIETIANNHGEFDVSKAMLVRYVQYWNYGGGFYSYFLARGTTNNDGINYLNGRKTDDYILEIHLPIGNDPDGKVEFVSGGSFDTRMIELLETEGFNCDSSVWLGSKDTIYITAVDPESLTKNNDGNYVLTGNNGVATYNSDGQYPVNVSDLFGSLTNGALDPGQKFDTNNWEFWPCYMDSDTIFTKAEGTVHDNNKITIDYYKNNGKYNDVLVYFPKVDIAPSLTVTAPSIGGVPSFEVSPADEIGGYTVVPSSASWSVGGTPLTGGAKFEAGKQYTFSVVLKPDTGLQFAETTKVKINGNNATTTLNANDGTLTVSYTFDPDHSHSYGTQWKSDSISHWHECDCGEKADIAYHISDNGVVTLQPTETSEGIMTYSCTICDYILRTETIPANTPVHTHNYGTAWYYDSSCHWHECSCGDKSNIGQHISNGGIVTVQPTAYTTGVRTYSCSVCGYVLRTETIPATGYNYPSYPTYPTYPTYPFDSSIFNVVTFTDKVNVTAETNENTITLKWDKVEKADKYYVYQYKNGKYVKVKTTSDTSATFKKLKNGETYKFLIRYTKSGRLSPTKYSGTISVKIYYKPIPKPTASKNSIKLTWEAVPEAEKYAVYKYVDGKVVKLTETKKLSVKIGKLKSDTEYKYIVRAYINGKWTTMTKSDIVTVKTKAE